MQSDNVAVEVGNKCDEPVRADRKLVFHDRSAVTRNPASLNSAVFAGEVDDGAVTTRLFPLHTHQRARRAGGVLLHRKGKHGEFFARIGAFKRGQFRRQHPFVERAGPRHVLHINLKPTDWILLHSYVSLPGRLLAVIESGRFPRRHFPFNPLPVPPPHQFKIITHLQPQPIVRRKSEVAR